ncbi:C-C motif chemokine 27 [Glossophaga mutica]
MKRPLPIISFLLLLLLLTPDPAAVLLPSSTTCCIQLSGQPLSSTLLRKVTQVQLQEADGDCHLQAYVLHLSQRSVCIHSQNHSMACWFVHQGRMLQGSLPNPTWILGW